MDARRQSRARQAPEAERADPSGWEQVGYGICFALNRMRLRAEGYHLGAGRTRARDGGVASTAHGRDVRPNEPG